MSKNIQQTVIQLGEVIISAEEVTGLHIGDTFTGSEKTAGSKKSGGIHIGEQGVHIGDEYDSDSLLENTESTDLNIRIGSAGQGAGVVIQKGKYNIHIG